MTLHWPVLLHWAATGDLSTTANLPTGLAFPSPLQRTVFRFTPITAPVKCTVFPLLQVGWG